MSSKWPCYVQQTYQKVQDVNFYKFILLFWEHKYTYATCSCQILY